MDKEQTYRAALVQVIQWMDCNSLSNTKMRRIVDMVLNHDASIERAIERANQEQEVLIEIRRKHENG